MAKQYVAIRHWDVELEGDQESLDELFSETGADPDDYYIFDLDDALDFAVKSVVVIKEKKGKK